MNYHQLPNPPINFQAFILGLLKGSRFANANAKKIYKLLNEDFAGSMTSMKYRYWEANHLTDQV